LYKNALNISGRGILCKITLFKTLCEKGKKELVRAEIKTKRLGILYGSYGFENEPFLH
jgi:hypothetical protein